MLGTKKYLKEEKAGINEAFLLFLRENMAQCP